MFRSTAPLAPILCLCAIASGQDSSPRIPGDRPGTERWIVHFEARSFDLADLAAAVHSRQPVGEVDAIVRRLESSVIADQATFVASAQKLGASVVRQWWIINACAVDVPPASLPAMRAIDNVARLEADAWARPGMMRATNQYNHDADRAHAAGHRGAGVAVAIMDSGADVDMNGSGRPHATYFRNGNPSNTSGSGIAGSRLVVCKQIGAWPTCDDASGHGTQVAAIAAGAAFGPAGVGDGHAPEAYIASYGIADQVTGAASGTTMVTAWQTITADVVQYNIVAANNSYQGYALSDPLGGVQMALDSAVLIGDLLVTAIAGNNPAGAPWGQCCVNGLAVGAVEPDSHYVVDYSGRGPQIASPRRDYPDISGCTHTISAAADCETVGVGLNGTSAAGPQVAGAAALVRSVAPGLRADQTKALLLATCVDISRKNPRPPNNTRNAYGAGLLRDSAAVQWAKFPSLQARGSVDPSNATWRFGFEVKIGHAYAVAIAWHRTDVTNAAWSNLDLQILDGTQVVGSSNSTRNLDEIVRFTASKTGTLVAEVTALNLQGAAAQPFGLAISPEAWPISEAGAYLTFGDPCSGSGQAPSVCLSRNSGAQPSQVTDWEVGGKFEYGFELGVVGQATTVTGCEFLGSMAEELSTMTASLYRISGGLPGATPLASGSAFVSSQNGWHRIDFATPYSSALGERLVIGLRPSGPDLYSITLPSGAFSNGYVRGLCNGWSGLPQPWVVGMRLLCVSSSSGGAQPHLYNDGVPKVGANFGVRLSRALPGSGAVLLTGSSSSSWLGVGLPLSLGLAGAPGCTVLASGEVQTPVQVDAAGAAAVVMRVPATPSLVSLSLFQQWLILDAAANPLGLVLTAGGEGRVGN